MISLNYTKEDFLENALTKTVGLAESFREPGLVGTGTSTRVLKITSEQQAESRRVGSDGFPPLREADMDG